MPNDQAPNQYDGLGAAGANPVALARWLGEGKAASERADLRALLGRYPFPPVCAAIERVWMRQAEARSFWAWERLGAQLQAKVEQFRKDNRRLLDSHLMFDRLLEQQARRLATPLIRVMRRPPTAHRQWAEAVLRSAGVTAKKDLRLLLGMIAERK